MGLREYTHREEEEGRGRSKKKKKIVQRNEGPTEKKKIKIKINRKNKKGNELRGPLTNYLLFAACLYDVDRLFLVIPIVRFLYQYNNNDERYIID